MCRNIRNVLKVCNKNIILVDFSYNNICLSSIRYADHLGDTLSIALLIQFGVSGIVLCTCAYILSEVSSFKHLFFTRHQK